ncbi:MAG: hypothetical protein DMF82_02925 [Acidobacteria bacterium]|nr:MAG: hypothetical protein DMF82_02925 [Acidobacteriota bacterium]
MAPLVNRLWRGEGALLAVNVSIALAARPDPRTLLASVAVSTAVLVLLYMLNDVYDCHQDLHDAGKDQVFVRFCIRHRGLLFRLLGVEQAATVALALALLGARSAAAVAAVFLVNIAYSARLKGRAAVDVPWVALWGACYAMVPGVPLPLTVVALVGVMTSICHVFQITRDLPFDVVNHIRTSAVAVRWLPLAQLAAGCLVMGFLLHDLLGPVAALSAAVPILLRLTLRSNQAAWMMSKAYYGLIWLCVLGAVRGF